MKTTWKPQVAGILSIVGGTIGLMGSFGILIAITAIGAGRHWAGGWTDNWDWQVGNVIPILWAIGIPMFLCSLTSVVGGIFAVQRKLWGLALAGSITAFFPVWIFGLMATIFTAISKDEFKPASKTEVIAEKTN
jgi:hypothetical protein